MVIFEFKVKSLELFVLYNLDATVFINDDLCFLCCHDSNKSESS